jgi:hypothetical protein
MLAIGAASRSTSHSEAVIPARERDMDGFFPASQLDTIFQSVQHQLKTTMLKVGDNEEPPK